MRPARAHQAGITSAYERCPVNARSTRSWAGPMLIVLCQDLWFAHCPAGVARNCSALRTDRIGQEDETDHFEIRPGSAVHHRWFEVLSDSLGHRIAGSGMDPAIVAEQTTMAPGRRAFPRGRNGSAGRASCASPASPSSGARQAKAPDPLAVHGGAGSPRRRVAIRKPASRDEDGPTSNPPRPEILDGFADRSQLICLRDHRDSAASESEANSTRSACEPTSDPAIVISLPTRS